MVTIRILANSELTILVAAFPEEGAAPENRHVARSARQQHGEVTCLVAWEDTRPVGYVFARWPGRAVDLTAQARDLGCVEFADLFVREAAHGRGVGRALMEAVEALAVARGYDLAGFEVAAANPYSEAAVALYAHMGYQDAGAGEFVSGYTYYDAEGKPHRDEEQYRYLTKRLAATR